MSFVTFALYVQQGEGLCLQTCKSVDDCGDNSKIEGTLRCGTFGSDRLCTASSTTVTFCEDQYHGGSACHTAFAVGKPAYPKRHTWRWGIEPCRHLPERQCGTGGTSPQHGHKG